MEDSVRGRMQMLRGNFDSQAVAHRPRLPKTARTGRRAAVPLALWLLLALWATSLLIHSYG